MKKNKTYYQIRLTRFFEYESVEDFLENSLYYNERYKNKLFAFIKYLELIHLGKKYLKNEKVNKCYIIVEKFKPGKIIGEIIKVKEINKNAFKR